MKKIAPTLKNEIINTAIDIAQEVIPPFLTDAKSRNLGC